MLIPICLRAGLLVLIPTTLFSQVDLSSVSGTVLDGQGGQVAGVAVRAIQIATGLERTAVTSSQGSYAIDALPSGTYSITFSKIGFSDRTFERVEQVVGRATTLNAQLAIAGGASRTTVVATVAQLDAASAVVGAAIEQKQIEALPLNGRNWTTLTVLTPGAIDAGSGDQRSIRFSGHGLDDNDVLYDGVDATGIMNQAQKQYVRLAIPLDAISEFQVKSQNFNADIGMTAGGQVSVVSPSGANALHASLFHYFRNKALNARTPFDGSSPAPFLLNQFGGNVSGPLKENKTFFFGNYEGLRQRLGRTQIGLVPSPAFIAQAESASPALTPLLSAYPQGTSPASKNPTQVWNYVAGLNSVDNEDSGVVRLDQRFTVRTTAFVRYSQDEADYIVPTGSLSVRTNTDTKLRNGAVDLLHVFSPTLLNDFKLGVNQDIYHTANLSNTPYTVAVSGLSGLTASSTTDGAGKTFSFIDDVTWVRGRHVVRFGGAIRRIDMNQGNSFSGTLTYNSLANLLGNTLDGASYKSLLPLKRMRKTQYYAYLQDEVKLTPSLTVNLGLRYNVFNAFHETQNRAIPFDFITCGGFCPRTDPFSYPRYNDFDPRVGIAWQRGKTILRAGGGIYHSDGQLDDQNLPISNDVAQYTLTAKGSPGLKYPFDSFLQSQAGILSPRDLYLHRKDMYVAAWTASLQRILPGEIAGTITYAGNKGTDILTTTYTNLLDPSTGIRPYPAFGPVSWRGNDSNSTFHSLQLNARRSFRKDWLFSSNFMWSHAINDDGIGGGEADTPQSAFCRACEKASSDYDARRSFSASAVYRLPKPALLRLLLGGWQLSGIFTGRSGLPVNRDNTAIPGGFAASETQRPNLVPGVSFVPPGGQTVNNWINPAAFAVPTAGTFGNAGRNLVRGPALWQLDMALAKTFSLSERAAIQFRAEGFNLTNRAQYGNAQANLSTAANFGVITTLANNGATGSGTPRQLQLALRINF